MFEVLIRETAARFGLEGKAAALLQMLLSFMTSSERGGLPGFLEPFKTAELGPIVQSWLGGGPSAQPISDEQLESVLGGESGLLASLASRLGIERQKVTPAVGYLLPVLVGKLTPGGSMPSKLPAEVSELASQGSALWSAPRAPSGGNGLTRWLPWVIVAIVVLVGIAYWSQTQG